MGVMTDATGRLLVNAVGGVDTSGLAKDSTLQSVNNTLGQIKTVLEGVAAPEADNVSYDNITSGLTASNVQDAIDELIELKQDDLMGGNLVGPDFNTLTENKNYWINASGSTNGPVSSGYGYLEVIAARTTARLQRYTRFASSGSDMGRTYIRYYANNQWYSWIQIY